MEGMLLLASFAILLISMVLLLFSLFDDSNAEGTWGGILFFVGMIMLIFFFTGVEIASNQPWVRDKEPYRVEYLYSLEDNNLTSGRGYYKRVRIDTDLYYQYMYKSGSGYKYNKVKANQATVFEDDTTPRVEFYEMHKKWFIFEEICKVYRIYVPKATIAEDYNIDLE